jgi:hypothetical protein
MVLTQIVRVDLVRTRAIHPKLNPGATNLGRKSRSRSVEDLVSHWNGCGEE